MSDEERKDLLHLLDEAESGSASLKDQAEQIAAKAQSVRDDAQILRGIVASPTRLDEGQIRRLQASWRQQNDATRYLRQELRETIMFYGATTSGTNASSTSTVAGTIAVMGVFPPTDPALAEAAEHYAALAQRGDAVKEVRAELVRCGLGRQQGDRLSALKLVDDAERAIALGDGAIASLIPLRQAIETTIDDLLRRSPGQEKASGWVNKMLSIGRRSGRQELLPDHFRRLGELTVEKVDRLSAAKGRAMPRQAELVEYYDGLIHLSALLAGIDEKKLGL